jgi:hypothetical protein
MQNWIAANVPHLHPGQVPMLEQELRLRGWHQQDMSARVVPYVRPSE